MELKGRENEGQHLGNWEMLVLLRTVTFLSESHSMWKAVLFPSLMRLLSGGACMHQLHCSFLWPNKRILFLYDSGLSAECGEIFKMAFMIVAYFVWD